MPNFVFFKYMFAMVPTNRAIHNKKKCQENLCIYTLKEYLRSLVHWYNEAITEIPTRQADFSILYHINYPSKCLLE